MESILPEVAYLQNRIGQLIVENEEVSNKFENLTMDSNTIIKYLKKKVEDQDENIARMEENMDYQNDLILKNYESKLSDLKEKQIEWEKEKIDLIAQTTIIKTQIGQYERMNCELKELKENNNCLQMQLEQQQRSIEAEKESFANNRKKMKEILRNEIKNELMIEIEDIRSEIELQKETAMKTSCKIIEKLEGAILTKNMEIEQEKEKGIKLHDLLQESETRIQNLIEENTKLHQLLEGTGKRAEKQLREANKRAVESEKKRLKAVNDTKLIIDTLKSEARDAEQKLKEQTNRCAILERNLNEEQMMRNTITTDFMDQNKKLKQLKEFLMSCLKESNDLTEEVLGENRQAIYSTLTLLISRIPLMKDDN
ncbi:unnamed protein product [Auanema sp. JU1783]|nr:unnamed protein product [Auanema sp. JU1783]